MLDRMLQNVRVCARLTRRSSDVVWNQMLVLSGYQAAHLCAENTYIELNRVAVVVSDHAPWRLARGSGKLDSVIPNNQTSFTKEPSHDTVTSTHDRRYATA